MQREIPLKRVLIVYQAPWDYASLWNRSQPLALALSSKATVLYLNCTVESDPKLSWIRRIPKVRSWISKLIKWGSVQKINDNLFVYHWKTILPNEWFAFFHDHSAWTMQVLRRTIKRLSANHDAVWLVNSRPAVRSLTALLPWDRVIVDIEDPWLEQNWGKAIPVENITYLLKRADVIFSNGPALSRTYSAIASRNVVNLANGVDRSFLAALSRPSVVPSFYQNSERLRVVFTGQIGFRFDYEVLLDVLKRCPFADFYFIGKKSVYEKEDQANWNQLSSLSNCLYVSPVPHSSVPSVLMHAHVLMLPYSQRTSGEMYPGKLFEYIASGKPIVSTINFEISPARPDSFLFCPKAGQFADALSNIHLGKWALSSAQQADCSQIAQGNSWEERADRFFELVSNPVAQADK